FSRTQGARRKLSEPKIAGQRPEVWLCSQLTTSEGDSHLFDTITHVCADSHVHVKRKNCKKSDRKLPILRHNFGLVTETRLGGLATLGGLGPRHHCHHATNCFGSARLVCLAISPVVDTRQECLIDHHLERNRVIFARRATHLFSRCIRHFLHF